MDLYSKVKAEVPDRYKINYGASVLRVGRRPSLDWSVWLAMFKWFKEIGTPFDERTFSDLKYIISEVMGADAAERLESASSESLELFGG